MSLGGTMALPGGSKMPKGQRDALIAAVSAVLAALIAAAVTLYTSNKQIEAEREHSARLQQQLDTYQAKYENAPKIYIQQLGTLINAAPTYKNSIGTDTRSLSTDPDYVRSISVSAQTIVAARNDLRSSLDAIGNRLDSQIDQLQAELAKPSPDPEKLVTLLEVLRQKWPAKEAEIELAVRKVITELGLVPVPAR
jgi:DNA repair exonuclease SbcCD ATPase subunit